ncbi:MAG: Holliday junction resolvase RuvX [Actinobacteria bacterium]|nr:Holliday junction resolvase RuvX [Actinomycetota bacterium]
MEGRRWPKPGAGTSKPYPRPSTKCARYWAGGSPAGSSETLTYPEPPCGRIAALDLGEVRTGVAVSDPERVIARPLEVVPSTDLSGFLERLVREEGVSEIVVGVPRTLGGDFGFQARKVLDRLDALKNELPGVRFVEWDERLTTRMAVAGVKARDGKKRKETKRVGRVDHLAAARMLQEYLESRGDF